MIKTDSSPNPGPSWSRYLLPVLVALITVGVPAQIDADARRDIARIDADARVRAVEIGICRDHRE